MYTYFATAPETIAQAQPDGHLYLSIPQEMYRQSGGLHHVRQCAVPRLLRVSHVEAGVAFAELGKAGDAIACLVDLPKGVVTRHTA